MLARDWGQLITAVAAPAADRDTKSALGLAMSLGSAVTRHGVACSVTQLTESGYRTPVWSDPLALDLDQAQYDSGVGPCVSTALDGQVHTIAVMADDQRYPAFTAAAVQSGVKCSLSLPLSARSQPGALNLYARATDAYDSGRTRATAELLARCVGMLLADDPVGPNPGLAAALTQRGLIEQAETELIRQGAFDRAEAYVRMTRLSRSENRSIFAIAADLVGSRPTAGS